MKTFKTFRTWLANKLVALARRIDSPNQAATAFMMDTVMDAMITGSAGYKVTRLDPEEYARLTREK